MFFAGIFSSHIPYIILAILYSIGFGTYSVNYIYNKLPVKNESAKEINFVHCKAPDNSCIHFQEYRFNKQVNLIKFPKASFIPFFKLGKYIVLSNIKISGLNDNFVLFSRPPPCAHS